MRPRGLREPRDRREGRRGTCALVDVLLCNRTPYPDAPILRVLEDAKRAAGVIGPVLVRVANSRLVEPGAEARPGRPPEAWLPEADRGAYAGIPVAEGFLLVRLPHPGRLGATSGRPWLDARAAAEWFEEACRFGMARIARFRAEEGWAAPYRADYAPQGFGVGATRTNRKRPPAAALGAALLKQATRVEAAGPLAEARRVVGETEEVS